MDAKRRLTLRGTGVVLAGLSHPPLLFAASNHPAFDAEHLDHALDALGLRMPAGSEAVRIDAPDFSDDGRFVPVRIRSTLEGTRHLAFFVDRNPFPYVARFEFGDAAVADVSLRTRIAESSTVRAIAGTASGASMGMRELRVTAGGCAGGDGAPDTSGMPHPIKIRARMDDAGADVRILAAHPMENGLRKDAAGRNVPEHFIQHFSVSLNERVVLDAQFGRSMSADPLLALRLRGARRGDRVRVTWEDNHRMTRTDESTIA